MSSAKEPKNSKKDKKVEATKVKSEKVEKAPKKANKLAEDKKPEKKVEKNEKGEKKAPAKAIPAKKAAAPAKKAAKPASKAAGAKKPVEEVPKKKKRVTKKKVVNVRPSRSFTLDCNLPVTDGIMDIGNLEKFLHDRIKVENKPGNLGGKITLTKDKTTITFNVKNGVVFAKRYIKYLVKKYLKKQ
eukprot:TRINITY_DN7754_c0_g1_i1.p2 TRINITY_DN7754_c0_g1~~TRINITY_DN7754_c0_g1_i1.p2  ORF type:complete len:186 (+),score=65.49 TRINITY_DN7754_c0_g1_i1:125-682(+)